MMIDDMAATAFFARSGGALVVAARRVGGVVVDRRGPCGLRQGPCHVSVPAEMGHATLVSCFFRSLLTLPRTVLSLLQFGSLIRM